MHLLGHAVDSIADGTGFSGVVRVDRGDEIELAKAYGLAHRGCEISNTVDTQMTSSTTSGSTVTRRGRYERRRSGKRCRTC